MEGGHQLETPPCGFGGNTVIYGPIYPLTCQTYPKHESHPEWPTPHIFVATEMSKTPTIIPMIPTPAFAYLLRTEGQSRHFSLHFRRNIPYTQAHCPFSRKL